jgi:hypothetical protein
VHVLIVPDDVRDRRHPTDPYTDRNRTLTLAAVLDELTR